MAEDGIGGTLGQIRETLGSLEQALRDESDALTAELRDPEVIAAVAQRKQQLVAEINSLMQGMDRQLAGEGLAAGVAGLESWLGGLPHGDAAYGVWQSILDISARCKNLNETNGVQIGLLNRRAQDALSVLLGGDGGSDTYGADGGSGRIVPPSHSSYKA